MSGTANHRDDDVPVVGVTRYEVRNSIAHLTLDRPEVLNAINPQMLDELSKHFSAVAADPDVHAVVLRGAGGKAFSAGVDLKYFAENDVFGDAGASLRFTATIRDALRAVETCPVPTVAVIDGLALAGGLELALCCDVIICSNDSQIGDQHANFDLMPGAGATQRLPRRIGTQQAYHLLFTGARIDGVEAARIGLALRSVPRPELDGFLEAFLHQLRGKSRAGLEHVKRATRGGLDLALTDGLELERLISQEYFSCYPDARTGLTGFMNRGR